MENCATHQSSLGWRLLIACALIILSLMLSLQANAQNNPQANVQVNTPAVDAALLQPKPNRCVALHQGQVCYQTIQLLWNAPQVGNYCLHQENIAQPLHCWQSVNAGEFSYEFASDASVQLQLVDAQTKAVVAQTGLEVAWVYKANTRRQTHWRLF